MNVSRTRLFTRYGTFVFLLAVFAAGTLYWPALAKHSQRDVPVRNYGVIWAHQLTRSGLPDSEGWIWLRQQGVRSIVTFRTENDVDYWALDFEHVMHIPISGSVMPTETQAVEFLKFIQAPANQPVHIHCTAGRDRTGMMTALARYSIDGWTLENALSEARQYRDGKDLSARRIAWLRAWAKEHPPGAFKVTP
jgi:hypothetical protein